MAIKYTGSFLKGLGEGLGTGFQMAQQAKEWKWQKEQKEKIQKEKDDLTEAVSIFNKKIEGYYADGTLSDDEKLQLNTAYLASAYNVQEVIQGSYDAIMKMDKDTLENNLNWFKFYKESIGDFDPSDIPGLYEFTKGQMIGEKGKQMFVAGDNLLKKQYEAKQNQPEDVWGQAATLPMDVRDEYLRSKGINIPEATITPKTAGISDYNSAATYLSKFVNSPLDVFNKEKASIQNKFGIDVSNITQESLREPEKVSKGIEPETVSTLKSWEDMFNIKSETGPKTEDEYNRALELLTQSGDKYTPKYPSWKEALISEVKGIGQELKGTTDKEDYNLLLNVYMQKLEEIKTKYPEVNLSQFPTFEKPKNWFQKFWESGKYSK